MFVAVPGPPPATTRAKVTVSPTFGVSSFTCLSRVTSTTAFGVTVCVSSSSSVLAVIARRAVAVRLVVIHDLGVVVVCARGGQRPDRSGSPAPRSQGLIVQVSPVVAGFVSPFVSPPVIEAAVTVAARDHICDVESFVAVLGPPFATNRVKVTVSPTFGVSSFTCLSSETSTTAFGVTVCVSSSSSVVLSLPGVLSLSVWS